MSKPAAQFTLSEADRTQLRAWLRKATLDQRLAQRARILLELDAAVPPAQISARLGLSAPVVFKWRKRYQERGLAGLSDRPRPGRPRKLTEQKVREILTLSTQRIPAEATHWSLRLMAKHTGATVYQVRNSPFAVEAVLRIHFLQQWFGLSDVAMQEALFDVPLYRQFAGLGGGTTPRIPDRVSILGFRHLLERGDLAAQIFAAVSHLLAQKDLILKRGTAVDAIIIAAPSSTKNKRGKRDPQMHQTKKGKQYYFGMKSRRRRTPVGRSRAAGCGHERSEAAQVAHVAVDADSGLVHTGGGTAANAHDVTQAHALLHGQEVGVFGACGYRGAHKRQQVKDKHLDVKWHIAMMPGRRRRLDSDKEVQALTDERERTKVRIRAKVEHPFRLVKRQVGHIKTRYKGLAKNTAQLYTLPWSTCGWRASDCCKQHELRCLWRLGKHEESPG